MGLLKNRWKSYLALALQMGCRCTHIPREGNLVADALAKNGQRLAVYSSQWWSSPLSLLFLCLTEMLLVFTFLETDVLLIDSFVNRFRPFPSFWLIFQLYQNKKKTSRIWVRGLGVVSSGFKPKQMKKKN